MDQQACLDFYCSYPCHAISRNILWLIFNNQYTAAQRGNCGQELLLIFVLTAGIIKGELHRPGGEKKKKEDENQSTFNPRCGQTAKDWLGISSKIAFVQIISEETNGCVLNQGSGMVLGNSEKLQHLSTEKSSWNSSSVYLALLPCCKSWGRQLGAGALQQLMIYPVLAAEPHEPAGSAHFQSSCL